MFLDSLTYELKAIPGRSTIHCLELKGFLYAGTLNKLSEAFQSLPLSANRLIVYLNQVSYVSTGAWSRILELQQRLKNAGGKVVLYGLKPEVQDGFDFMELGHSLEACVGKEEAMKNQLVPLSRS